LPDSSLHEYAAALRRSLGRIRRGYRLRAALDAVIVACAATGLVQSLALATGRTGPGAALGSALIGFVTSTAATMYWWRTWTLARTARAAERRWPHFENLLVTAEEALDGRTIHPVLANDLYEQAAARLDSVDTSAWKNNVQRAAAAVAIVSVTGALLQRGAAESPDQAPTGVERRGATSTTDHPTLRATITPPAYSRRPATAIENPVDVEVFEGSRVQIDVNGTPQADFVATAPRVLLITIGDVERLVNVAVKPDAPPIVSIERPGRDLVFGAPSGKVAVTIKAHDDLRVAALTLRYTRIAGSGETFAFQEGEVPVHFAIQTDASVRQADGALVLDQLDLDVGDTLVYRAIARDDKPGRDPVASESFLIEIGKRGEAAAGGFAVPEDRDRQALSQQMLIMKTERLHADRARLSAEAALEQSRLLAVEQRMVRAEFLFMTGGEVVDEVEEAEHSHEIAQGRFENQGQIELLNAIREMSRAEARLNGGDTVQALVFERAALQALQRAFDRRRYFLRTLPERARIDLTRRLSGDVTDARSATRAPAGRETDASAATIRHVVVDLANARRTRSGLDAQLAARIIALNPGSAELRHAAIRLSTANGIDERLAAASSAQTHLLSALRARLAVAAAERIPRDPLLGALADRLAARGVQR
jgi:hypothetical protein